MNRVLTACIFTAALTGIIAFSEYAFALGQASPLSVGVSTDRPSYARGESIGIKLIIKNTGTQPAKVGPGAKGRGCLLSVTYQNVTAGHDWPTIWRSTQSAVPCISQDKELAPNEQLVINATWDGQPNIQGITGVPSSPTGNFNLIADVEEQESATVAVGNVTFSIR
jgi:hypothetical protein